MDFDFFSQLDQTAAQLPINKTIMVRYRTRFQKDVIYSKLSTNKDKTLDDIAASVSINDPSRFLPQPWPTTPITDRASLLDMSVQKMKAIVNVGLGLPTANSSVLNELISKQFPMRLAVPSDPKTVISCEVRIAKDGEVNYVSNVSQATALDPSLLVTENGRHGYIKAMLILGLQTYLESTDKAGSTN